MAGTCPTSCWHARRTASGRRSTSSSSTESASCRCRSDRTTIRSRESSGRSARRACSTARIEIPASSSERSARSWIRRCPPSTSGHRSTTRSRCCPAGRRRSLPRRGCAQAVWSPSSTSWSTWPIGARVPTEAEPVTPETIPSIRTPRLELVSMTVPFMEALLARDPRRAGEVIGAIVPGNLRGGLEDFLRYRLAQLAVDPSVHPWLGRAMVLTDAAGARRVIGTIGFHGPPDELGRLEIGYSVQAAYRRQGFAREAVRALFDWAASEHGIRRFIASVSPTNDASLALVHGFGFRQTGEQMDEIDGLELVLEADWPPDGA